MHILIVRNNSNQQAVEASLMLSAYLSSQNIHHNVVDSLALGNDRDRAAVRRALTERPDLAIVLGGDGTILHSAHLLEGFQCPLLPINFGTLGFLANGSDPGVIDIVSRALAGELAEERRETLSVRILCEGEADPFDEPDQGNPYPASHSGTHQGCRSDDDPTDSASPLAAEVFGTDSSALDTEAPFAFGIEGSDHGPSGRSMDNGSDPAYGVNTAALHGQRCFMAFNEAAISRGTMGRVVKIALSVSGRPIAEVRGDGYVVASSTGSTGYALSAGGPLIAPQFSGLVAVPIAPHTLNSRAIVTEANDVVELELTDTEAFRDAELFIDGELMVLDSPLKKIYVTRGPSVITLLRDDGNDFYDRVAKVFF